MRINELLENIDFDLENNQKKSGLDYDLVEDLTFFINHDDNTYRKFTYPAILKLESMISSGKSHNQNIFKDTVTNAYENYCNKYQIRELPDSLDEEMCSNICAKLHEEFSKHILESFKD